MLRDPHYRKAAVHEMLEAYERMRIAALAVNDGLELSAAGDECVYRGSTNAVDRFRDAEAEIVGLKCVGVPRRANLALEWCTAIFGKVARDPMERASRFAEEAIELAQAARIPADVLAKMIERVYSRPAGDLKKEIGQAAITLELFAHNAGIDADVEASREFARVQAIPKEEWQRRHEAKVAIGIAI
jgi:NTP pyrophosphatase (non-canonical NTP hydrolase)